jgi:RNA polymerase sigma-70 factor, ECF subfamily
MIDIQTINWSDLERDLKGFVHKRVKDKALTEDIVHDVFLKAYGNMDQVRDSEKLVGWIYQIARNTITDHYRRKSRSVVARDIDWESNPPNYNDCVTNAMLQLIPTLPDMYRIPLEMTEMRNISQLDVARTLNLNYATAKARVQRARQMLKKKMEETLVIKTDGFGNVILCKSRNTCA